MLSAVHCCVSTQLHCSMSKSPWWWSFAEDIRVGVCLCARKREGWGKECGGNNHKLAGRMFLQLKSAGKIRSSTSLRIVTTCRANKSVSFHPK
jgi:hypothetical protein